MHRLFKKSVLMGLGSVFLLTACGSNPNSSRDMYRGETGAEGLSTAPDYLGGDTGPARSSEVKSRSGSNLRGQSEKIFSEARLAAVKEFDLEKATSPDRLIGFKSFDLRRVMGDPVFVRREEGIEIWQYQSNECIVDLFLYDKNGEMIVDHAEIRGPRLNSPFPNSCFSNLLLQVS